MKRRKALVVAASVLAIAALGFAIVYLAYPRVLLRAYVALQRSNSGFQHRWVTVDGWSIPCIDSKRRGGHDLETIAFIHGFGDTKDRFLGLADGLTNDYRVVAFDLPGFGESANRLDAAYSSQLYVDVILGALDQLGVDSAHLVGYSMGGMLATAAAARAPSRVRTLTLLAPAGLQGKQSSDVDRLVSEGTIPLVYRNRSSLDRLLRLNFNNGVDFPEFALRAVLAEGKERADLHTLIFRKLFDPSKIPEFENQVAALKMPTLLIWGDEDRILDVSAADRWSEVNPSIQVVIIPRVGHALIHQRMDQVRAEFRSHLSAASARQTSTPNPTGASVHRSN